MTFTPKWNPEIEQLWKTVNGNTVIIIDIGTAVALVLGKHIDTYCISVRQDLYTRLA